MAATTRLLSPISSAPSSVVFSQAIRLPTPANGKTTSRLSSLAPTCMSPLPLLRRPVLMDRSPSVTMQSMLHLDTWEYRRSLKISPTTLRSALQHAMLKAPLTSSTAFHQCRLQMSAISSSPISCTRTVTTAFSHARITLRPGTARSPPTTDNGMARVTTTLPPTLMVMPRLALLSTE